MPPLNMLSRSCLALAIGQAMLVPVNAATIVVNDNGDTDGADAICTLREAIVSANTNPATATSGCVSGSDGLDTITFINSGPIAFSQSLTLQITEDLVINGPSSDSPQVIDGAGYVGVFKIADSLVELNNLTITGGNTSSYGGALYATRSSVSLNHTTVSGNFADDDGGGIFANLSSNISLNNSTVSGNSSTTFGGGIEVGTGSAVSLNNSTVSGNSSRIGGGIFAYTRSSINLVNSTVSGNSSTFGGGLLLRASSASLSNSSVSGNTASDSGGAISVETSGSLSLLNSILAGNSASTGAEINAPESGFTMTTDHNVLGDNSHTLAQAFFNVNLSSTDINATSVDDGVSDHQPTDISLILEPIADNGGVTFTHALAADSPAIDAGSRTNCGIGKTISTDQRGEPRNDGQCDIGAYEEFDEGSSTFVVPIDNGKAVIFSL